MLVGEFVHPDLGDQVVLEAYSRNDGNFTGDLIGAFVVSNQPVFGNFIFINIILEGKFIIGRSNRLLFLEFIFIRINRIKRRIIQFVIFFLLLAVLFKGGVFFYLLLDPLIKRKDGFLQ